MPELGPNGIPLGPDGEEMTLEDLGANVLTDYDMQYLENLTEEELKELVMTTM